MTRMIRQVCQVRRSRVQVSAVVVFLVVVLGGCADKGALVKDMTPVEAETESVRLVEETIAQIDPAVIKEISDVRNESSPCRDPDVDPEGKVQMWVVQRDVWLFEGVQQTDLVGQLIQPYLDDGWVASIDEEATSDGGRVVQLLRDGVPGETFGLSISADANDITPPVILIRSSSPCYLDPDR